MQICKRNTVKEQIISHIDIELPVTVSDYFQSFTLGKVKMSVLG